MIRIRTASRLHFGLFSLPSAQTSAWLNHDGEAVLPRRQFGGVGLMIDRPGIELSVEPAQAWSVEGPLAARALQFAQTFCNALGVQEAFRVRIESAPPEHVGLGTGTQLGLAVADAIANCREDISFECLRARTVGRGRRSAIGVHGFDWGGFIVEAGKVSDTQLSPMLVRRDFPEEWRILLLTPRDVQGTHGGREMDAFAELAGQEREDRTTDTLCRLVLLGMLPALIEPDLATFGESLYDFNRRVGEMFRPAQRGIYAHPRIDAIVKVLRDAGVRGVGQSSWGPTIYAVVEAGQVADLREWLIGKYVIAPEEVIATWACNHGARSTREA